LATVAKIRKPSCVSSLPMFRLELITKIKAPQQVCFDLARNIDAHVSSLQHTKEKAIAGRINGLIEKGETVTWEARHFGINWRMTVLITEMRAPDYFCDEMRTGPFKKMRHEHFFTSNNEETIMKDVFECAAPFGIFGRAAEIIFLKKYMKNLLLARNAALVKIAEQK
jgi:ligand-binding SRPBCC domain-containing protein